MLSQHHVGQRVVRERYRCERFAGFAHEPLGGHLRALRAQAEHRRERRARALPEQGPQHEDLRGPSHALHGEERGQQAWSATDNNAYQECDHLDAQLSVSYSFTWSDCGCFAQW
jgi:hypothetical protein